MAGKIDQRFDPTFLRTLQPEARHLAAVARREQQRAPIVLDANSIWKNLLSHDCARLTGRRIVAKYSPVRPSLDSIKGPGMQIVTHRGIAEIDFAVRSDVEIVGEADDRIIPDAQKRSLRLIGQFECLTA